MVHPIFGPRNYIIIYPPSGADEVRQSCQLVTAILDGGHGLIVCD